MLLSIWLQGLSCFTGFPLLTINVSLPAELITPDEHRLHSAGPLSFSKIWKVLLMSGSDHHTWDFQGQFLARRDSHLFRFMRDTSLNSTCIKPSLSANPSSSTTGREIKTNTTHCSSKQILKEFHVAFPDPSTSRLSLLCSNIKMKFCTIPPHTQKWRSRSLKQAHKYFCFF